MRVALLLIVVSLLAMGCQPSPLQQKLQSSDSLIVQFFNEKGVLYKALTSTEKPAIKTMTDYLGGQATSGQPCMPDGRLIFFQSGKEVQRIKYSYKREGCQQFLLEDSSRQVLPMNKAAAVFLLSLEEGEGIEK